jgi:ABC-type transporter Mla MlaB component
MPLTLEKNDAGCVLRLEGEITVNCAAELHRLLVEATASATDVSVGFAPSAEIDVSAIQLLYAARREAVRTGRVMRAVGELPAQVRAAFGEVGIDPFGELVVSGGCAWER